MKRTLVSLILFVLSVFLVLPLAGCEGNRIIDGNHLIIGTGQTVIRDDAYSGHTGLAAVDIPNTVTTIGQNAFHECTGLTSVTIPDSVTEIGSGAFYGCSGLTSVTIPDSVTKINSWTFSGCTGLTSVTIPGSVTSIGQNAFHGCTGLTSVTIPDSVTEIGYEAFSGCAGLTSVTIPDSVITIRQGAFVGCTGLTSVTIPDSVTEIDNEAFSGCTGLTSVTIPDSVATIGMNVFSGCTGLTSVTIPDSVTGISSEAFSDCIGLTSVTIPDSVTWIGSSAFSGCTGLTSVTIPDSVAKIGADAFSGCSGLEEVTTTGSASEIRDAFPTYQTLREIHVTTDLSSGSFSSLFGEDGCKGTVIIRDTVTKIDREAFSGCVGLTAVTIPDSVTEICDQAFYGCTGLTSVTIPDSVTEIGSWAFSRCSGLETVTITGSPGMIDFAFGFCENLREIHMTTDSFSGSFRSLFGVNGYIGSVVIEDSMDRVASEAFSGCVGLTSVTIPDSVTEIGGRAFSGCTGLTAITIPDSVTSVGDSAFSGCTGLTSITIPDSVTSVGDSAFSGCTGLTSITIPDSVTSVGDSAFSGCTGLTSLHIPDSVTSIGTSVFSGCTGLESVMLPWNAALDVSAFGSCPNLRRVCFTGEADHDLDLSKMILTFMDSDSLESVTADKGTGGENAPVLVGFSQNALDLSEDPADLGILYFGEPRDLRYSVDGDSVKIIDKGSDGVTVVPLHDGVSTVSVRDGDGPTGTCTVEVRTYYDVLSLMENGDISVSVSCGNIRNGSVRITNNTDHPLSFAVLPGTYMKASGSGYQNMAIMSEVREVLDAGSSQSYSVSTCCMNIHRDIPTEDNQFSLAMSDNELLCALADYCQKNPVDYPVRQAATWILTDNASFYDCGILQTTRQDRFISYNVRVITEQNYNDAEKLLETLSESLGD